MSSENVRAAIETLSNLDTLDTDEALEQLEQALDLMESSDRSAADVEALFRLLEKFPNEDGYGAFWQVLHMLEATRGYERYLVESVRRMPTEFNMVMVNRRLNGTVPADEVGVLTTLLLEVRNNASTPPDLRKTVAGFCSRHEIV